jgi:hypothetical protein
MTPSQFDILSAKLTALSFQIHILILIGIPSLDPDKQKAVGDLMDQLQKSEDLVKHLQDRYDRSAGNKPIFDKD